MMALSLIPGLAYIALGWMGGVILPALVWYGFIMAVSLWGWRLYSDYTFDQMSADELKIWYRKLVAFFYLIFSLWTLVFILYADEWESNIHYIAIFTQLGASVVASTLLVSDKKLFSLYF